MKSNIQPNGSSPGSALRLHSRRPPRMQATMRACAAPLALLALLTLAGCKGSDTAESATVTVNGDVPITYAKRSTNISIAPTNGAPSAPGGDLMVKEKASASAPEYNVTAAITQGVGDVSDPEASYDGKKIVFALKCPAANTSQVAGQPACTGRWNIWEYDTTNTALTRGVLRRLTASTVDDDVDPVYLPANRGVVFSSNRQTKSKTEQALGRTYYALDEYERERVFNLHTMNAQGENIAQITFNQSHDRNPVVRANGDIMFSRWEHVADRNRFAIFTTKPDGTNMFVLYGAQSPGNSFLHPREMDPKGAFKGFVASSLMPLSGSQEGGALMFIDAAHYSEQNTPASSVLPPQGGQAQITTQELNMERGLSTYGRITTPYPLWDGTDRVLLAYRPCEVTRNGVVESCTKLTAAELSTLGDRNRTNPQIAASPIKDDAPAAYSIYMYNPVTKQNWLIVASPPPGFMYTDPIALQPRTEPNAAEPTNVDPALAAQNLALIEVRSVYDTDGLNRMSDQMLAAADLPAGCTTAIAKTRPAEAADTRALVADLVRIKDPADEAYRCAPARFVRAVRAVAPPANSMGVRSAIGETDFEQQQILGYAPVEPDGSFKLKVPADVPLAFSIIDAQGRAFQTHTNWIQVRPGERRTCDGCHSPRRGAAINSGAVVNSMPAALKPALTSAHLSGETMASLRTRLDPAALQLSANMVYEDLWADTSRAGVTARPSITLKYTGNPNPADDLVTAVPANGIINYPEHIAPLWTRDRGTNTCITCHGVSNKLDLRSTQAGTGRLVSYERLLLGEPLFSANGAPITRLEDGVPVIQRGPALVVTSSGAANTAGQSRKSRLTEIMFGQTLLAGSGARNAHPNPPTTAPDHSTLLNNAEKRVLAEWMDLGGQYYNDPLDANAGVRTTNILSEAVFVEKVHPILTAQCGVACHQAVGSTQSADGISFRENRLVLTGDAEGDFNVTLSMISDTCTPASNFLLARPSTLPHPAGAVGQVAPPLPLGSTGYNTIAAWIASGCARP